MPHAAGAVLDHRSRRPALRPVALAAATFLLIAGGGSGSVRLTSLGSDERVQIVLVCVDPVRQELICPASLRTEIQAVDPSGTRVGDLVA